MELPKNKYEHWKAKFIDGLPPLFAKRVRKILRNEHGEIHYNDYTYGRLIGVYTQEGINLSNELKLSRQLKIEKLRERSQLGNFCTQFGLPSTSVDNKKTKHKDFRDSNPDKPYRKRRSKHRHKSKEEREDRKVFHKSNRFTKNSSRRELAKIKCYKCGNFGHIAPNCKLEKLKTLEFDEEVHDNIYSFLCISGSESDYDSDSSSEEEIEFPDSSDKNQHVNTCNACEGDICSCDNGEFYKLQSQFEDLNINTITSDNVIELLKEVTQNNLREKIIQLAVNNPLNKQTIATRDSSFDDLKTKIENLKNEIKSIKQNQIICDYHLTKIETINNKGKNIAEENTLAKPFNLDPRQGMFLGMMQIVTTYKCITAKGFSATYENQNISYRRGRSSPGSLGSSYKSFSSSSPIIQRGGMSLFNLKSSQKEASSLIHLEDFPENSPLYAQLQVYLSQKQSDTFASIAKEDVNDIKS
ncbi:hypothetical protein H5410_041518 [Solanum commersonii]|uniref:CCHC-type domain-containing protein n=1 Tax=Solanum commersonii TaxID=4109 RepID=A0A9J5XUS5_SOLCO|nr:hypothetical protein H5410_041518 [Solanum commersonii]